MKRFFLFFLAFLVAGTVLGDALYKWVDEQGNVHYSDKPMPGATKMKTPHAQTFKAPTSNLPTPQPNNSNPPTPSYTKLAITEPADHATFWNVHSITVSVDLEPGLQSGDTLTLSVDGQSKTGNDSSATFDNLDRGEHSVTASVSNNGTTVIAATPVTFYIQQARQKPGKAH